MDESNSALDHIKTCLTYVCKKLSLHLSLLHAMLETSKSNSIKINGFLNASDLNYCQIVLDFS